jgi:GTP-binding protein
LLFVVSADSENPIKEYKTLLKELKKFNPELLDKKRLLGISKLDLIDEKQLKKIAKKIPEDLPHVFFSAATNEGIELLKDTIWQSL